MKYTVTAICISRKTVNDNGFELPVKYEIQGLTVDDQKHGVDEIIDTEKNELFKDCKNEYDVEDRYEYFWNRLNGGYTNSEIVKVVNVVKEEEESK